MKFTSRMSVGPIATGILTVAALGLSEPANNVLNAAPPTLGMQNAFAAQEQFQTNSRVPITQAVERIPADRLQTVEPQYLPITAWYKNKHWWKKNAPIIGGAAGGGLIGGLAGGGKGFIIGGAAGAGGGALYKHYRHHNHHYGSENRVGKPTPNQGASEYHPRS